MNDYRITYTGESEGYQTITERTETAAKKFFLSSHKGIRLDITSIELYRENTSATKQQERDTLETIKKMVEELGPQSYLATAFEGCFQDAENNIENDFGDSMKARWQHTETQLEAARSEIKVLKDELAESKKDYEAAHAAAHQIAEQKDAEIATLQARALTADDLTDISRALSDKALELGREVSNASERIVEAAENPESAAFQNAVKDHRAAKADLSYYTELLSRVNTVKNAVIEMGGADNA